MRGEVLLSYLRSILPPAIRNVACAIEIYRQSMTEETAVRQNACVVVALMYLALFPVLLLAARATAALNPRQLQFSLDFEFQAGELIVVKSYYAL